ncbi:hypothetical protein [Enemella dayhoffiae]|nr:hypothetical protein [Enemella dayhoffiae]
MVIARWATTAGVPQVVDSQSAISGAGAPAMIEEPWKTSDDPP